MRIPKEGFFESSDAAIKLCAFAEQEGDEGFFRHVDEEGREYQRAYDHDERCIMFAGPGGRVKCPALLEAIMAEQKRRVNDLK